MQNYVFSNGKKEVFFLCGMNTSHSARTHNVHIYTSTGVSMRIRTNTITSATSLNRLNQKRSKIASSKQKRCKKSEYQLNVLFAGAITNASERKKSLIRSLFDARYWSGKVKYNLYIKFCTNECERVEPREKRDRERKRESGVRGRERESGVRGREGESKRRQSSRECEK